MQFQKSLRAVALLLAAACLSAGPASAQSRYVFEDEDEKPWQEMEAQMPPAPQAADLLPLDVGRAATQNFAIDPKSLTVGADDVIRYTVVATSPAGATSTNYEGIRCRTFERRVYAFGHKDGTWAPSRNTKWERIRRGVRNGYPETLALDFFCEGVTVAGKAPDMVQRIKEKRVLNPRIQY
jgi:hypothetical protein